VVLLLQEGQVDWVLETEVPQLAHDIIVEGMMEALISFEVIQFEAM